MAKEKGPKPGGWPWEKPPKPVRRDRIHHSDVKRSIESSGVSGVAKRAAYFLFDSLLSGASGAITVGVVLALFGSAVAAAVAGGASTAVVFGLITIARKVLKDARARRN